MKNFSIIFVIIAVFIIGYNLISKNKVKNSIQPTPQANNQPTPTTTPKENKQELSIKQEQEELTITYDKNGFAPKTINIPVGATVTFTNKNDSPMWVASDPHPTHSDFPEFDQKQSVAKGENYIFTFDKKGSWQYHNHLSPSAKGVVVVE